jgi:hypothetical protein
VGTSGVGTGRHSGVDGRSERRALCAEGDGQWSADDVGVELHQEAVLQQAADDDEFLNRHARIGEGLDDAPSVANSASRMSRACPARRPATSA